MPSVSFFDFIEPNIGKNGGTFYSPPVSDS